MVFGITQLEGQTEGGVGFPKIRKGEPREERVADLKAHAQVRPSTSTVTYAKWMGRTPRGSTGGAAIPRRGSADICDEQERDGAL